MSLQCQLSRAGSAVLIVLIVMSAVSICCFNIWRTITLEVDLTLKSVERELKYKMVEGVLNYSNALCMQRYKSLKILKNEGISSLDLTICKWVVADKAYEGRINLQINDAHHIKIKAFLFDNQDCVGRGKYQLQYKKNKKTKQNFFMIDRWKVHA